MKDFPIEERGAATGYGIARFALGRQEAGSPQHPGPPTVIISLGVPSVVWGGHMELALQLSHFALLDTVFP